MGSFPRGMGSKPTRESLIFYGLQINYSVDPG